MSSATGFAALNPSYALRFNRAGGGRAARGRCLAEGFGRNFIDYFLRIKEAELARYHAEVTEWEQREYFELF